MLRKTWGAGSKREGCSLHSYLHVIRNLKFRRSGSSFPVTGGSWIYKKIDFLHKHSWNFTNHRWHRICYWLWIRKTKMLQPADWYGFLSGGTYLPCTSRTEDGSCRQNAGRLMLSSLQLAVFHARNERAIYTRNSESKFG